MMKRVLITGANSYIGDSVRDYLIKNPGNYVVDVKDTLNWIPLKKDFEGYDVVFNVAGIAHTKETAQNRHLYYEINRDLIVRVAKTSKEAGVKQFIVLSSMSVYGLTAGHITKRTRMMPTNAYGRSKAQADVRIKKLVDDSFKVACIRPPMVYGKGCKGNYQKLRRFALKTSVFPDYKNIRSMIYIGNLCEFVKQLIDKEKSGLFFPQNEEYVSTRDMVKLIAKNNNRRIWFTKAFNFALKIAPISVMKKVFGDLTYEKTDVVDKYTFEKSMMLTEQG